MKYLMVRSLRRNYYISPESEIEQSGSLILFYVNTELVLAINTEDFLWAEIKKPAIDALIRKGQ